LAGFEVTTYVRFSGDHRGLPIPVFLSKSQDVALQAADLIAWCHHLYLTMRGKEIRKRYSRALESLARVSNEWGLADLDDLDKIPSILSIPLRNSQFTYRFKVITKGGRRRAVVHFWPRGSTEPKLERETLVLPEQKVLLPEEVKRLKEEYETAKAGSV
jgi:hypothetical protein